MKRCLAFVLTLAFVLSGCSTPPPGSIATDSSTPTSSATESMTEYTDGEKAIIYEINSVLNGYNNGSLPKEIVWYSDNNSFVAPAPSGISLPKTVDFEALEIATNNNYLYEYSVNIIMPLADDYSMLIAGGASNEELTDFQVGQVSFSDNIMGIEIDEIPTSFGNFSNIKSNRLISSTQFVNLELRGFPSENTGYISVDKVRNFVTLFLSFPDNTDFIAVAKEFEVENISQKYGSSPFQTELDENSIYNAVFFTAPQILKAIIEIHNLNDSKRQQIEEEISDILQKYRDGIYPLPIIEASEYHINSPFPSGEQIPQSLDKSALTIEANGGSEYHPYVAELALDGGNTMVVFFSLIDPEQKISIDDVVFKDKNNSFYTRP